MKKPLLFLFLFSFFITHSQNPNLFNRDWHIHELSISGSLIDIPILPANPPADCIVGLRFEDIGANDFSIDASICWIYTIFLDDFDQTNFNVIDVVQLGGASCFDGNTAAGCEDPPVGNGELLDFQINQVGFYDDFQSTFTYAIIPPGSGGFETLHIEKPNGDYAIYGEVPPLSLDSNSLDTFFIYPNPASDVLYLNGKIQEIKAIAAYNLSGQKMNIKMEGDKIDVSEMPPGLYFLEITTFKGNKTYRKFIKR